MAARGTSPQLDALGRSLALRHVLVSAMPPTGSLPALPADLHGQASSNGSRYQPRFEFSDTPPSAATKRVCVSQAHRWFQHWLGAMQLPVRFAARRDPEDRAAAPACVLERRTRKFPITGIRTRLAAAPGRMAAATFMQHVAGAASESTSCPARSQCYAAHPAPDAYFDRSPTFIRDICHALSGWRSTLEFDHSD